MSPSADPLQALRPLHLPDPISWWPPAPGWWLLGFLLLVVCLLLRLLWRRNRLRRAALKELRGLQLSGGTPQQRITGAASLLRRYAILSHPDKGVPGLCGEAWLQFLDDHGGGGEFGNGVGRGIADMQFAPQANIDDRSLMLLVARWIRKNRGRG